MADPPTKTLPSPKLVMFVWEKPVFVAAPVQSLVTLFLGIVGTARFRPRVKPRKSACSWALDTGLAFEMAEEDIKSDRRVTERMAGIYFIWVYVCIIYAFIFITNHKAKNGNIYTKRLK